MKVAHSAKVSRFQPKDQLEEFDRMAIFNNSNYNKALLMGVLLCLAWTFAPKGLPIAPAAAQQNEEDRRKSVFVEELFLTNSRGEKRASFALTRTGDPQLQLFNRDGKTQLILGLSRHDSPFLHMLTKDGKAGVSLEIMADDSCGMTLARSDDSGLLLFVPLEGAPGVSFIGNGEKGGGTLRPSLEGTPGLVMYDRGLGKSAKIIWRMPIPSSD